MLLATVGIFIARVLFLPTYFLHCTIETDSMERSFEWITELARVMFTVYSCIGYNTENVQLARFCWWLRDIRNNHGTRFVSSESILCQLFSVHKCQYYLCSYSRVAAFMNVCLWFSSLRPSIQHTVRLRHSAHIDTKWYLYNVHTKLFTVGEHTRQPHLSKAFRQRQCFVAMRASWGETTCFVIVLSSF